MYVLHCRFTLQSNGIYKSHVNLKFLPSGWSNFEAWIPWNGQCKLLDFEFADHNIWWRFITICGVCDLQTIECFASFREDYLQFFCGSKIRLTNIPQNLWKLPFKLQISKFGCELWNSYFPTKTYQKSIKFSFALSSLINFSLESRPWMLKEFTAAFIRNFRLLNLKTCRARQLFLGSADSLW